MEFEYDLVLMSLVIFIPTVFALLLMLFPRGSENGVRWRDLLRTALTFLALDFFLFYIFWEVMLLPMYFLIGVWGGPRREYAAIKFFLFTLLGSVFILIAMLAFYFTDVRDFDPAADPSKPKHTFDLVVLQRAGSGASKLIKGENPEKVLEESLVTRNERQALEENIADLPAEARQAHQKRIDDVKKTVKEPVDARKARLAERLKQPF